METKAILAELEAHFSRAENSEEDRQAFASKINALIADTCALDPPAQLEVIDALTDAIGHSNRHFASSIALAGGAIVEQGTGARQLAERLVDPLFEVVEVATRLLSRLRALGEAEGDDAITLGAMRMQRAGVEAAFDSDHEAAHCLTSLNRWYLPAVASWSLATDILERVQKNETFAARLMELAPYSEGAHWLSILSQTTLNARFAVLFPETRSAYSFVANGVSDCGQLTVLLADALSNELATIEISDLPSEQLVSVMKGDGPQRSNEAYSSSLHFYSWKALNPETGEPDNGRHEWRAPGGTGTHSLPGDFLPYTIAPLNGVRVLIAVGPNCESVKFVRGIGGSRTFESLKASLDGMKKLSSPEADDWFAAAVAALK